MVEALRRAGALILGKTNMTEFANYTSRDMPDGFSARGGQVKNAYGPDVDPSGSSSGSAAAVSAGLCAAALGTDTCHSITGCATLHGVCGLKPTAGALPSGASCPSPIPWKQRGPLTRDLSDAILVYACMRARRIIRPRPRRLNRLRLA